MPEGRAEAPGRHPLVTPLLCHPLVRKRNRPALYPGPAGAQQFENYGAVYPCGSPSPYADYQPIGSNRFELEKAVRGLRKEGLVRVLGCSA